MGFMVNSNPSIRPFKQVALGRFLPLRFRERPGESKSFSAAVAAGHIACSHRPVDRARYSGGDGHSNKTGTTEKKKRHRKRVGTFTIILLKKDEEKENRRKPGNSANVTFLGWLSDPFSGCKRNVWGSKGHGLNHLECVAAVGIYSFSRFGELP